MRTSSLLALLASLVFVTAAEDGAQVYNTLCVACHGPDGKGLNGLPPDRKSTRLNSVTQ